MITASILAVSLALSQGVPLEPIRTVKVASQGPCVEDATTLCLLDHRLEVRVRFRDQHAGTPEQRGRTIPFGERTGFFWFFEAGNIEVLVKALDAADVNESLWVFVASLSDVEFWVEVTDTVEGQQKMYYNPPGNTYGIVDTSAFPSTGAGAFCGGIAGVQCAGDLFCDLAPGECGTADAGGVCVETTDACPEIFAPVCGCDGTTYVNDCERRAARVAKDHDGECGTGGQTCGTIAGLPCPDDSFFCDLEAGQCQTSDLAGVCVKRPDFCIEIYDPVCGCDGKTYANDCFRVAAGVAKDHDGECDTGGEQVCGTIAGLPCPDESFVCDLEPGQCQTSDLAGVCVERPDGCFTLYEPVCGCDGVTYGNDCDRLVAGVALDHEGECAGTEE